jgi:hypothetical protein
LPAERTGAAQPESIIANSVLQARPERACALSSMGLIAIGRRVREYTSSMWINATAYAVLAAGPARLRE